jgi:uncharacterized protein
MRLAETARANLETRGRVPIFPLPGTVFFPETALALHIFEPRYRQMTEEALRSDRMIAVALLKPGWEHDYDGSPEVFPLACAGLIEEEVRLPDGRFNIRLRGLARVAILGFDQAVPYRIARVRVLEDRPGLDGAALEDETKRLLAACAGLAQEISGERDRPVVLDSEVPFPLIVNTLCQNLGLEPETKQQLLAMDDVVVRGRRVVEILTERWRDIALRRGEAFDGNGIIH